MRILIASDVHCGYGEMKKFVYEDSFESFEEVLVKANTERCDFILLGGDLFHENQPNRDTQIRVMRLIRQHCMSGPETLLKITSDGDDTFSTSHFKKANIEDENLTVSIPIFTIHGNHDDLTGQGTTAVDLFHEAGVLNLFGRFENIKSFSVNPVLLEKENADGSVSKVALYGIGSQRDDRLARALQSGNVKFNKPQNYEEYLNILVLHQNRPRRSTVRSTGSYVPTELLPGFMDLVVWGHEHASIVVPEKVMAKDGEEFLILQPGSTVATSLCPDEAMQKHCFVLDSEFDIREPNIIPLELETCRQIIYEDVDLDVLHLIPPCENIRTTDMADEKYLHQRMSEILRSAELNRNSLQPELPLVRLRVHYTGLWMNVPGIIPRRFGRMYLDNVANPNDIISTKTYRTASSRQMFKKVTVKKEEDTNPINVEVMVQQHFKNAKGDKRLAVLNVDSMNKALEEYGENDSTSFAKVNKKFNNVLQEQLRMYMAKITELTAGSEDDLSISNYKDFEEKVGKCIYSNLVDDEDDNKDAFETIEIKQEQKENTFSDSDIEWIDK